MSAVPTCRNGGNMIAGMAGAWIGLTIQHCGNHGAMSTKPIVNTLLGMTDDLIGGSSLMWRYHHQVSKLCHASIGQLCSYLKACMHQLLLMCHVMWPVANSVFYHVNAPVQVSHHIHCNDLELDEDVFSAFPFLRFDARLPRKWFHQYQHIYMVRTGSMNQLAMHHKVQVTCQVWRFFQTLQRPVSVLHTSELTLQQHQNQWQLGLGGVRNLLCQFCSR